MAVDRHLWNEHFTLLPSWTCPRCQGGTLRATADRTVEEETGPSQRAHSHEAWEPDWIEKRFAALLQCQNATCGELVAISGMVTVSIGYDDRGDYEMTDELHPRALSPAPHVFRIPDECPKEVATELKLAFSLLWQDTGSAANRLRVAVEALLTERGVPRSTLDKKRKRAPLGLHARIERFGKDDPEAAEYLMAIKWVGNSGSHASLDVDRDTLLDGFELFERAVDDIYIRSTAKLKRVAKALTARKGRPRTTKRSRSHWP